MLSVESNELRGKRRLSAILPLKVRAKGSGDEFIQGETIDMSASGVAFMCTRPFALGAQVEISMFLPSIEGEFTAEGSVVRIIDDDPTNSGFEYGVHLDEASLRPEGALTAYLKAMDITPLLELMVQRSASNMYLSAQTPVFTREKGQLKQVSNNALSTERVDSLITSLLNTKRRRILETTRCVDFPLLLPGLGRWRVNAFYQNGVLEATFQTLSSDIPTIESLGLPDIITPLALADSGLVLVNGPVRSGKSSTVAALLNAMGKERERVIVTIEDPIEFVFTNGKSLFKQRQVGTDTSDYASGVNEALRQSPDVIVVDAIPDHNTAAAVLRAAETGFLVIAQTPARDFEGASEYLANLFPREERRSFLFTLSRALFGSISQRLIPAMVGGAPLPLCEVIRADDPIRNTIAIDKINQLSNTIHGLAGCQTFEVCVRQYIAQGLLDKTTALQVVRDPRTISRGAE